MIEELLKQIKQKEEELSFLNEKLEKEGISKYNFLVGKFYCLAATCKIQITGISYLNERTVNVECIKIQGGKYDGGNMHVSFADDYNIKFSDIENNSLNEITGTEFFSFLQEAVNETIKKVSESIG